MSTKKNPYKRDSVNDTDDAKPLDFTFKKWDTLVGLYYLSSTWGVFE